MPTPSSARRPANPDWFHEMRQAFEAARFSDAAAQFDSHRAGARFEATLLRARIFFKEPNYPAAIALLSKESRPEKSLEAERLMLLAVAHSRTNRFEEADELFARAEKIAAAKFFPVEFPYMRGRRYLDQHEPARARKSLDHIRQFRSTDARVLGDLLETGILSQEENYTQEARLLVDLIRFMDSSELPFVEESIHALRTLSGLARELDNISVQEFVKARVTRQLWTDDFLAHEFQTLKAVGWCYALQGDYFTGLRYLKMAGRIAPSQAWRAMTLLDRSYLARCIGEKRWSRDELWEADESLSSVNWRETNDEERVALIIAAELYAPVDSGKAAAYLAKFSELRDAMNPMVLFRHDSRLAALADYAAGIVDMHFGNENAAITNLKRAWQTYNNIGYSWRAGRAALQLFELTSNRRWHSRAIEKLEHYKNSWLWNEIGKESQPDEKLPHLTPAQKNILQMLYDGKTTKDICLATGRSVNTIENHIKAILKAFDLPNRATVLSELVRRGITSVAQRAE